MLRTHHLFIRGGLRTLKARPFIRCLSKQTIPRLTSFTIPQSSITLKAFLGTSTLAVAGLSLKEAKFSAEENIPTPEPEAEEEEDTKTRYFD